MFLDKPPVVMPSDSKGLSALTRLGMTVGGCRLERSEGSPLFVFPYHREEISRYARKDKVMRGYLAIARQNKVGKTF
jgi:hypothetical protein